MKRRKINLMKEKEEIVRLVKMMLLLKKTYNYSMRFRCEIHGMQERLIYFTCLFL
jgi:hypothetical protein